MDAYSNGTSQEYGRLNSDFDFFCLCPILFCNLKTYVQDFHNKTHATETSLFAPGPFFLLCLTNLEE